MTDWDNCSGRPLSSYEWLLAHHQAKIKERTAFAKRIAENNPQRVVDLGSGYGLWLDLLSRFVSRECELVGFDTDSKAIDQCSSIAKKWEQKSEFNKTCFCADNTKLPKADIYLAFNVFPYVDNGAKLLDRIRKALYPDGILYVRQYDGDTIRLGPMNQQDRNRINSSVFASVSTSDHFKHYDMDRVFSLLQSSNFKQKNIEYELFQRASPYSSDFIDYYQKTVEWMESYANDIASNHMVNWADKHLCGGPNDFPSYFLAIDLVAELS